MTRMISFIEQEVWEDLAYWSGRLVKLRIGCNKQEHYGEVY